MNELLLNLILGMLIKSRGTTFTFFSSQKLEEKDKEKKDERV
jgi:hypothetical protein